MSQHTPGPWRIGRWPAPEVARPIQGPQGEWIADVCAGDTPQEANASLIAAAPVMLAAIIEALQLAQVHDPVTGYYKPVNPYELQHILRAALPVAQPKAHT